MKKTLIAATLLMCSQSVMAEWVRHGVSADENVQAYYDPDTIREKSGTTKVWTIWDFRYPQTALNGATYLSRKGQEEFNCDNETNRDIYVLYTLNNGGRGDVVFKDNVGSQFEPITPDSIVATLFDIVCN